MNWRMSILSSQDSHKNWRICIQVHYTAVRNPKLPNISEVLTPLINPALMLMARMFTDSTTAHTSKCLSASTHVLKGLPDWCH